MAAKPDTLHGKIFEKALNDAFSQLYKTLPVRWGRVLDSAAAGNLVKKADADFKLMVPSEHECCPFMFHIEAKATVSDKPFQTNFRALVKGHQNAAMVMSMRAGCQGVYFVQKTNERVFEIWDAKLVSRFYGVKRVAIDGIPAYTVAMANLDTFALQLCKDPRFLLDRLRSTRQ